MSKDLKRIAEAILWEEFPSDSLTLDETVEVANIAAAIISTRTSVMERKAEGNAFILWLGGVHMDIFVYGAQLLIKYYQVNFRFDEKTLARMDVIGDQFYDAVGYSANSYEDIDKFNWPKVYLDDSTFEDRLDTLAEEYASDLSPADLLLSGMRKPKDLDFNQRMQLAQDCIASLEKLYVKYGKSTILFEEQLDRFLGWLSEIEPEIALYAIRWIVSGKRLQFNVNNVKNFKLFMHNEYEQLLLNHTLPNNPK